MTQRVGGGPLLTAPGRAELDDVRRAEPGRGGGDERVGAAVELHHERARLEGADGGQGGGLHLALPYLVQAGVRLRDGGGRHALIQEGVGDEDEVSDLGRGSGCGRGCSGAQEAQEPWHATGKLLTRMPQ